MAGLCSGITEGIFINPFEVVKVKLQTEKQEFKQVSVIIILQCTLYHMILPSLEIYEV